MTDQTPAPKAPSLRDMAHEVEYLRSMLKALADSETVTVQIGGHDAFDVSWDAMANKHYAPLADALKAQLEDSLATMSNRIVNAVVEKSR